MKEGSVKRNSIEFFINIRPTKIKPKAIKDWAMFLTHVFLAKIYMNAPTAVIAQKMFVIPNVWNEIKYAGIADATLTPIIKDIAWNNVNIPRDVKLVTITTLAVVLWRTVVNKQPKPKALKRLLENEFIFFLNLFPPRLSSLTDKSFVANKKIPRPEINIKILFNIVFPF